MTSPRTLAQKVWDRHVVHSAPDEPDLLYIDLHLVHEVTSPQAYEGLKLAGRKPWRVSSIVATADHNTPTHDWDQGIKDPIARVQVETLDANNVNGRYGVALADLRREYTEARRRLKLR